MLRALFEPCQPLPSCHWTKLLAWQWLESVVAALARMPNGGLIAMTDPFLNVHRAEIISLAARYRLPAVYAYRFFTELGDLLSYGNDPFDNLRRSATYADRLLKGAKPSELPVQAPVKFALVARQ
jgi:putative tryptophan/tyrosine transport system substrate-binding protein